ncbi:porin family protein [Cesiribacter sp. SM1]|uniref:porin family protein n=1 Tax=Cesiribacter sp. SM1 TaxID=2861196 RepID=UPI001CD697E7|nr:porin family protein [Cesiribacter sp. SM1]
MKKGLYVLTLMLLASVTAFAQLRHEQQSQIGLKAGANFATIQDGFDQLEGIDEEPWIPRLTVGLATSFWANDYFAFAPEINYSQRGFRASGTLLGVDYTNTYHYDFVEVPLLFRATFGQQIVRGYINLGPTVSYMVAGKETAEMGGITTEKKIDTEDTRYSLFEVGGAAGGGLHINTGLGSFLIDLRYHTGFTNIQKEEFTLPAYVTMGEGPEKYRTQYVSLSLIFLTPHRE